MSTCRVAFIPHYLQLHSSGKKSVKGYYTLKEPGLNLFYYLNKETPSVFHPVAPFNKGVLSSSMLLEAALPSPSS
jgi:hypothetical protein